MSSYTNSDMESPSDIQNESDEDAPLITKKVESHPESDEDAPLITKKLKIPPDFQNESDEDVPLITKKKKTKTKARSKSKSNIEDEPLITVLKKRKSKKLKQYVDDDDSEDEYEPLVKKKKKKKKLSKLDFREVNVPNVTNWKNSENFADVCGYCEQTCLDVNELKDHLMEIHGETKNKCKECKKDFNFSKPSALQSHLKLAHGSVQSKQCGYCELTFKKQRDLKSHVVEKHKKMKNKCPYCEKAFNVERPIDLKRHIQGVHKIALQLKCDFCDLQFKLDATLKSHIRNVHTGLKKDFRCRFCQAVFAETLQLTAHTENIHHLNVTEWSCDFCHKSFTTSVQLNSHIHKSHKPHAFVTDELEDPKDFFQRYRGLWNYSVGIKQEHFSYVSLEEMLEFQKRYQDQFVIQIPPEDFTAATFTNFEFPKPIEELGVPTDDQFKMHYHCPYERCEFGVQKATLRQFAIHLYYHDNNHPQLIQHHECIACGLQTPYMERVQNHLKNEGAFHDNQCPRCPERFASRDEFVNHLETSNHIGYRCGLCADLFDTLEAKNDHKLNCLAKPPESPDIPEIKEGSTKPRGRPPLNKSNEEGEQHDCSECKQSFPKLRNLNNHLKMVHFLEEAPCKHCGKIYRIGFHLEQHVKKVHQKEPCTICGKMFGTNYKMKNHMLSVHTEDHLKPFQCSVCDKGFVSLRGLDQHMNIHTGAKPYECTYCGRGFTDDSNRRMHQKTAHEGYKRESKGGHTTPGIGVIGGSPTLVGLGSSPTLVGLGGILGGHLGGSGEWQSLENWAHDSTENF